MDPDPHTLVPYQYDILCGKEPCRLLTLHPAPSFSSPLRGDLETTDLWSLVRGEAGTQAFEALSYTWGRQEPTCRLMLGDCAYIEIAENLEAFLRYRREKYHSVRLWIDALCINQLDEAFVERNGQVKIWA